MKKASGFGLVEIIVVVAIVVVAVVSFGEIMRFSLTALRGEKSEMEATLLTQEGFEAMRALRDQSWNTNIATLANDTKYYLATTTAGPNVAWSLSTIAPNRLINSKFWRTLVFAPVNRDANDRIASSGGTLDSGTRQITVTVTWKQGAATSTEVSSDYLTNFLQN